MKILILSQWYPPEPDHVVSGLAEGLHQIGHEVMVLTGFPNYPSGVVYPGYRLRFRQKEIMNGVPVYRVPLYAHHGRSGVKRATKLSFFCDGRLEHSRRIRAASRRHPCLPPTVDDRWSRLDVKPSFPRPVHVRNPGHVAGNVASNRHVDE